VLDVDRFDRQRRLVGEDPDRLQQTREVSLPLGAALAVDENAPDAEKYKQTPGYKAGAKA